MTDNLFLVDINNKEHIKLIKEYEKKNNLSNIISYLTAKAKKVQKKISKPHKSLLSTYFISSVQFCRSAESDSWRPHGWQHARLLCPSPTPGTCPNSGLSSQWCHPTISSSVVLFSLSSVFPSIRVLTYFIISTTPHAMIVTNKV